MAKVVINHAKLGEFVRTDPGMQAGLLANAAAIKAGVEEASPFGKSLSWPWGRVIRHGWFKKSLSVRKFRHYARVQTNDPFGHLVEYGSMNNPAYAPFRRTLSRFGGIPAGRGGGGSDDS